MSNDAVYNWRKSDSLHEIKYDIFAVLSIGVVPIITVFFPAFGVRLRTVMAASPAEADYVLATIVVDEVSKDVVCAVQHLVHTDGSDEHIVAFQAGCQRYCASSLDKFEVYQVDSVPLNMRRFLHPTTIPHVNKRERDILALKYGPNDMDIPPTDLFAITVRHALNPLIIFGYFSIIIWALEGYYAWAGFLIFAVLATVYVLVEWTSYNLKRLRDLAGQHGEVQLIETCAINGQTMAHPPTGSSSNNSNNDNSSSGSNSSSNNSSNNNSNSSNNDHPSTSSPITFLPPGCNIVTASDTTLIVGDRFLLHEGMVLPCDIVLVQGRVVVDESMLTGESIPVQKLPIDFVGVDGWKEEEVGVVDGRGLAGAGAGARAGVKVEVEGDGRMESGMKSFQHDAAVSDPHHPHHTHSANDPNRPPQSSFSRINPGEKLAEKYPGSILFGGTRIKYCQNSAMPLATVSPEKFHGGQTHKDGNIGGGKDAYSIGVTYRTGYRSAKGQLVSSLLEPREGFLDFFNDMLWVIFAMFFIASLLFVYQAMYLISIGRGDGEIVLLYFDALTVAIPVALLVSLIISSMYSASKLEQKDIYVSDTSCVNYAGLVSCVCFDKTGTCGVGRGVCGVVSCGVGRGEV